MTWAHPAVENERDRDDAVELEYDSKEGAVPTWCQRVRSFELRSDRSPKQLLVATHRRQVTRMRRAAPVQRRMTDFGHFHSVEVTGSNPVRPTTRVLARELPVSPP